jgi:hypothetical protein
VRREQPGLGLPEAHRTKPKLLLQSDFGNLQSSKIQSVMPLQVGDPAPEFELPAIAGEDQITVRSRDYLGRQNLVVTFHPLDWTPT